MSSEATKDRVICTEVGGAGFRPPSPRVVGEQMEAEQGIAGSEHAIILSSGREESQSEHGDESMDESNAEVKQVNMGAKVDVETRVDSPSG